MLLAFGRPVHFQDIHLNRPSEALFAVVNKRCSTSRSVRCCSCLMNTCKKQKLIIIFFLRTDLYKGKERAKALYVRSPAFWNIMPCCPLKVNRRFGGTDLLQLHGRRISHGCYLCHTGFPLGILFDPDRGDMFLRNVCQISTDCTALCPNSTLK
jgi:hypothetical protein